MSSRPPADVNACRTAPRWYWALVPIFAVLVTANSAGYRFGVSDQAFYIPAIDRAMVPSLFPHDSALVEPQARLLALDEMMAWLAEATGASLPNLFLAGYCLTVLVFAAGVFAIGRTLYRSSAAALVLLTALTLRHRIAQTGVNTFEGYFHPRVLAFGLGLFVIAALLRRRVVLAAAGVAGAMLIHPTTGIWFGVLVLGALVARPGGWRLAAAIAGACTSAGLLIVTSGAARSAFVVMDPAWTAVFASKDYLFPMEWATSNWLANAIAPTVLAAICIVRLRASLADEGERGLMLGAAALVLLFLFSLPFSQARVALAVQLQIPRVLWIVDFLATAYLVWALVDRSSTSAGRRVLALTLSLLVVGSAARGYYVMRIARERPLVRRTLAHTPWQATADWAATHTPSDANFILDPDHAWKEDVSFRVAAQRDVYLEKVKDAAMATYSREVAMRVADRTAALGEFASLTPERATALARKYDLDYLIADTPFALPVVFRSGDFRVYALRSSARATR